MCFYLNFEMCTLSLNTSLLFVLPPPGVNIFLWVQTSQSRRRRGTPLRRRRSGDPSRISRRGTPPRCRRRGAPPRCRRCGAPLRRSRRGKPPRSRRRLQVGRAAPFVVAALSVVTGWGGRRLPSSPGGRRRRMGRAAPSVADGDCRRRRRAGQGEGGRRFVVGARGVLVLCR